jgi:hypothetical protein
MIFLFKAKALAWLTFIIERFHPLAYLPMIILFVGAQAGYLHFYQDVEITQSRLIWVLLLVLSYFFRLRLFDEIKDYETDLVINPTRPLARGLLKVSEVVRALQILILFEIIVAGSLGLGALQFHAIAIAYSLLMYKEFFIGKWLRPHLTTYAVTHTFSSSLIALSVLAALSPKTLSLNLQTLLFLLSHWMFFNLFEFARKTWAAPEERANVPSYSNIFGTGGAWLLSISQALLVQLLISNSESRAILLLYALLALPFLIKPTVSTAKLFRTCSALYLLCHYLVLNLIYWRIL